MHNSHLGLKTPHWGVSTNTQGYQLGFTGRSLTPSRLGEEDLETTVKD